jgi:cytosine/adenosine deaminase-related metal-dependent hydrolase
MLRIQEAAPGISLNTLIQWATKNGAAFLGMNDLGTFEKGKKPGIVQLRTPDAPMKISKQTEVIRVI